MPSRRSLEALALESRQSGIDAQGRHFRSLEALALESRQSHERPDLFFSSSLEALALESRQSHLRQAQRCPASLEALALESRQSRETIPDGVALGSCRLIFIFLRPLIKTTYPPAERLRCSLGRQPIHFLKVLLKTKGF